MPDGSNVREVRCLPAVSRFASCCAGVVYFAFIASSSHHSTRLSPLLALRLAAAVVTGKVADCDTYLECSAFAFAVIVVMHALPAASVLQLDRWLLSSFTESYFI
ncbi:hypothetical protein GUJ93_ZPchr0006g44947 [Zizania palustris]|uniref:Uncharacterized protein n=1 Tax=Zizania palustris TaxID=103762 RepID=A0A8J5VPX9_ZIZPA|nr:hypothetical protein GUJ93_ZPchr0006g44947 [Zizania palustris]